MSKTNDSQNRALQIGQSLQRIVSNIRRSGTSVLSAVPLAALCVSIAGFWIAAVNWKFQRANYATKEIEEAEASPRTTEKAAAFAAKAKDLDAIKKAVEDAAAVGTPLWLSYLFLLFYIAIAASAVTHADLLLERPVDLPFLNIKLPLHAFFIVSPILFIVCHAYIMAHFALLADKAKHFHVQLRKQINIGQSADAHEVREGLRRQLPINIFVQFLAGPSDIRESPFSILLWATSW